MLLNKHSCIMLNIFIVVIPLKCSFALIMQNMKESYKHTFDFRSSDFSKIVKTTFFVDRSLMIKDVLKEREPLMITAPRHFGKSVMIDMLKRFLEIEVDEEGNEIMNKTETANYKLFTELQLYKKHTVFFNLHFGTYPVIHIDFSPIMDAIDYKDLIRLFQTVVLRMYREHSYLLRAKSTWRDGMFLEDFKDFIVRRRNKKLTGRGVFMSFEYLMTLLGKHFKRPVVVLADNYDAFVYSLIHRYSDDKMFMVHYFLLINGYLMRYGGEQVCRSLATGVLRAAGPYVEPCEVIFKKYWFTDNHHFNKYYGLTSEELDTILMKATDNCTEQKQLRASIDNYYGPYMIVKQKPTLYNLWSILHFIQKGKLGNYWMSWQNLANSYQMFEMIDVQEDMLHLLQEANLNINLSKPLTRFDMVDLNVIHTPEHPKRDINKRLRTLFYYYHFQLGHMCVEQRSFQVDKWISVKVPSLEIKSEFTHILRDAYMNIYDIKLDLIDDVNKKINSISRQLTNDSIFHELFLSFRRLFSKSNYRTNHEFYLRRFISLVFRCRFSKVYFDVYNRHPVMGFINIVVENDHKIGIFIETKLRKKFKSKEKHRQCAWEAVRKMVKFRYINTHNYKTKKNHLVYLGLCYSVKEKSITFGYSKQLNDGEKLRNIAVFT